jgi:hypothetical protein
VREYPLLCINPKCRPADEGGPRRTERAWFCPTCIDKAGDYLREIADAWDDLEESLVSAGGAAGEPVKGSREFGLQLNERASEAHVKANADLWAFARMVLEWADDQGRDIAGPADRSAPGRARWIADWHLSVFTVHAGRYSALGFIEDVWADRRAVRSAAYPSGARKVETGLPCVEHATSDLGERIPCAGTMVAWVRPHMGMLPDLVCDVDGQHKVDPATWQRQGWKRAHTGPLDQAAMARLAERMSS